MNKIVPTISSGVAGPLGILHLPRLWMKASLDAAGKLHDEYPAIGPGYDAMVLNALEIDPADFETYIRTHKPSYIELESWILEKKGGSLDQTKVDELNRSIAGYQHDDATRAQILRAAGRPDDGTVKDAVNLNNLDDWTIFHAQEIKG